MKLEFMSGNMAIAEGAITAGMRFFAGYPITPASDIMEYLAEVLPEKGGLVVQYEDEIASINAALGASWAGVKSMTATSGPGFSLMVEALSLAAITETPVVVADIMRAGPSTGVPTKTSQSDVFQVRYAPHGEHLIPALVPWSVQEAYDLTIKAFNISELVRTPVILLSDAVVAHMWESAVIKDVNEVEIVNRKKPSTPPNEYMPYKPDEDLIPPMANFGEGYKVLVESLAHDERGYYRQSNDVYRKLIWRLVNKVKRHIDKIYDYETYYLNDETEYLIISYGSTARSALAAVRDLRRKGVKVGMFRPKTLWPTKEEVIKEVTKNVKKVFVVENNTGKMVAEFERYIKKAEVVSIPILSLDIPTPEEILEVVSSWL